MLNKLIDRIRLPDNIHHEEKDRRHKADAPYLEHCSDPGPLDARSDGVHDLLDVYHQVGCALAVGLGQR